MKRCVRVLGILCLLWLVVLVGGVVRKEGLPGPSVANPDALVASYARWKSARQGRAAQQLTVSLRPPAGGPAATASGQAVLDLQAGLVVLQASGLPSGGRHELWLVDDDTAGASHAGTRARLGELGSGEAGSALSASLDPDQLAGLHLDRLVVVQAGASPDDAPVLSGSPALFQRLFWSEIRGAPHTAAAPAAARFAFLVPSPAFAQAADPDLQALVAEGERLFFEESFGGNGRTCGTCHPAENDFTIDPEFIATLPADDLLFVAEFDPLLAELESPAMMREFGLIRANADGFEDPTVKFVLRSVPHMLGLALTLQTGAAGAPFEGTGWSADGAPGDGTLRDFPVGAVRQHFPRSLDRVEGVDFRLPTAAELDALEAFMLSLGRQTEFDLASLQLTDSEAERGREIFTAEDSEGQTVDAGKCTLCHGNAGALNIAGLNRNFDTGIEDMVHPADGTGALRPRDDGFGTDPNPLTGGFGNGRFNVPSLWEVADTAPYFHHNAASTLEEAISFYDTPEFKQSPEGIFILTFDTGGQEMSVEIDALAAFLRVINALENIRSATEDLGLAQVATDSGVKQRRIELAVFDLDDAVRVLAESELHPDASSLLNSAADSALEASDVLASASGCFNPTAQVAGLISSAVLEARTARDLMVVAPLVALSAPTPVPEFADDPPSEPSTPDPTSPPDDPPSDPDPPEPICNIYGCDTPTAPPPDPVDPPDPGSSGSAEGSAKGTVASKNPAASTLTVDTGDSLVTVIVTTATEFDGVLASNLSQVIVGQAVQVSFFLATNEAEMVEVDFPAGI